MYPPPPNPPQQSGNLRQQNSASGLPQQPGSQYQGSYPPPNQGPYPPPYQGSYPPPNQGPYPPPNLGSYPPPYPPPQYLYQKSAAPHKAGEIFAIIGNILVIVGFFSPWGAFGSYSITGYEVAITPGISTGGEAFFLYPLLAGLGLVLSIVNFNSSVSSVRKAARYQMIVAIVGLSSIVIQAIFPIFLLHYALAIIAFGVPLMILGMILMLAGGISSLSSNKIP